MIAATECPVKPIQSSVEIEKAHIEDTAYTTLHDNNPPDGDQHDGDAGNVAATPQQMGNLRAIVKNEVPDAQDDPPDDDVETQHSDHPPLSSEDNNNNNDSDQQRATPYSGGGDYQQQHSEQIISTHNSSIDENHRDATVKFEPHSNALGGSQDTHSTTASSADEPSTTIPHTANMDDTNSGGGGGTEGVEDQNPNTTPQSTSNTISIRRLFVGGLPRTATEDMLIEHFSVYGPIEAVLVPRDPQTGRTRGFGFVTFVELGSANAALKNPQIMNGREIDCKLAFPKDTLFPSATDIQKKNHGTIYQTNKVFIGGLNTTTQSAALRKYFDQYGTITSCRVVRDRDSNESRRFGFVEFEGSSAVDEVIRRSEHHMVDGKYVQVKRCIPQSRMHASSGVDYHGDYMHNISGSHHSEHSNHQHHGAESSNPYMRHNNPQPINTMHHPQENPQYLPPMSEYRNHPGAAGGPMIMSNDIPRNNSMSVYGYPCRGGMTLSSGGLLIHPPVSTSGGPPPPSLRNSMCGHYDADQMRGLYRRPNMGDSNAISGSPYNSSGENPPLNRYNEVPQTSMDMRVGGIRPPAGRGAYSDHSASVGAPPASYGGMMGPPDDGNCGCLDCYMNKGSPHNYGTSATGVGATRRDSMSPLSRSHTGSRGFHSNNYSTGGPQRRQPGVDVYDNRQPQNSPSYAPQRMIAASPNQPPSLYTSPYHCRPPGQSPAFHHHHPQDGPPHPGQEVYGSGGSALGGEMSTYGMSEVYHHGPGGYSQNEPTSPRGGKVGHMDDGPAVNRHRWTSSERNDSSYPYGERPSSRFEYEVGNEMMVPSGIPGGPPLSSFAPPRGLPADDYRINSRSSNEFRPDYSEHNHSHQHHNNRFRPVRDGSAVPMMYEGMTDVRSGQGVHSAVNYITRRPNNRAVVVDQQQPPQSPSGGTPSPHNQYLQRSDHEFEGGMSMAPPTPSSQDNNGYLALDSGSSAADHEQQRRQLSPTGSRWGTVEAESGGRKRKSHGYTRSSSSPREARHDDNNLEGDNEGNSSSEYPLHRDEVRRYHENLSPNNNLESCCEDNSSPPSRKLRRYEGGSSPPPPPCSVENNNDTTTNTGADDEMENGGHRGGHHHHHHHHHHQHSTTNEIDENHSSCVTTAAEEEVSSSSSACVNNNMMSDDDTTSADRSGVSSSY